VIHLRGICKHPQTNPNLQDEDGNTILIWAAWNGNEQMVTALLQHPQTNPNLQNKHGNTALTLASENGHKGVVSIIKDNLKMRRKTTIEQAVNGLYEAIHGRNPVMIFNQKVPKEINIEIAALTGDPSVHTNEQANEIASTRISYIFQP